MGLGPLSLGMWLVHAQSLMSDSLQLMDCSPPGSFVHGIFQAGILEWFATSFSKGPSQPRDRTHVSCISSVGRCILYHLPPRKPKDDQSHRQ